MDRIEKALAKLDGKEREVVLFLLKKIKERNLKGLDVKRLKGRRDIFRVRKGSIRIIYRISENSQIFILAIERRSERTYKI